MASKNHPISFRLKQHKITDSLWCARYNYQSILHDDLVIREIVKYTYKKKKTFVNQILIRRHLKVLYVIIYLYNYSKIGAKKIKHFNALRKKYTYKKKKKNLKLKKRRKKCVRIRKFKKLKKKKKSVLKSLKCLSIKKKKLRFENEIAKMIQKYCNIYDQKIQIISYDYLHIYNLRYNKIVNRVVKMVRYYKWIKNYRKLVELGFVSVQTQNTTAFCDCLAFALKAKKFKDHKRIVLFSRSLFKGYTRFFYHFFGFKIMIKGRLLGRLRAKKFMIKYGHLLLQTTAVVIHYNVKPMQAKWGTYGFRIWLCYTSSNNYQIDFINRWRRKILDEREKSPNKKAPSNPKILPKFYNFSLFLSKQMLHKASRSNKILLYASSSKKMFTVKLKLKLLKKLKVLKMKKKIFTKLNLSDIFLWHFLYNYFFKTHQKYPVIYFSNILNHLITSNQNKYKQYLIKKYLLKLVLFSLLKKCLDRTFKNSLSRMK